MCDTDYFSLFNSWKKEMEVPGKPNEWEVKRLLRRAGLAVPEDYLLKADEDLSEGPSAGVKAPYAVKLCSAEVLHKTDVGGVVLDVGTEELAGVLKDTREFLCPHIQNNS
jgi:acyl-CoA synthetase (NDP forming)